MAADGKRGPTLEQWLEIRSAYEAGESEASLSRRYGCERKTIRLRRGRESWTTQVATHLGRTERKAAVDKAKSQVIDIATRRAVETAETDGTMAQVVRELRDALVVHAELEFLALELSRDTLLKSKAGLLRPGAHTSEAGERKDAIVTYETAVSVSRLIQGLRPGQASVPRQDVAKPKSLRILVAPRPALDDEAQSKAG